jgi:hypothetical protein
MRHRLSLFLTVQFCLGGLALCASPAIADETDGKVDWPREWTVFAPFDRPHPAPDAGVFRSVPETLSAAETPTAPA